MPGGQLKKWRDMPRHLQFNKYVLSHYRPILDFKGCVASLFYLHNETVNIFTHAFPPLFILYVLPDLLPWSQISIPFFPTIHVLSCLAPWIGSTLYHLFMNHRNGSPLYKKLLACDMFGIWIAQIFGSLASMCATGYCFSTTTKLVVMGLFSLASLFSCHQAIMAESPWKRRFSFLFPFFFRLVMLLLRFTGLGGGHPAAIKHLVYQDIIAVGGGAMGAMNIPECWFPGKLDLIFNSHNIMHVLVVYAAYQMHLAVSHDLNWMNSIYENKTFCPI